MDNSNTVPWPPPLVHKPNAMIPLGSELLASSSTSSDNFVLSHPYNYEISHITYPSRMFEHQEPRMPKTFEETPFQWISTQAGLDVLVEDLKNVRELAVDLEHHDYRTYAGFLCLMQISTREKDYIIDTLALRDELIVLNDVFTNPNIVKVRVRVINICIY